MALQNFVDNNLPTIKAAWLNAIDAFYTTLFASATTAAQAMTALGFTSLGQSLIAAANAAAARTLLGSGATGDALFTAATAAAARSTLGTQAVTGVGRNIASQTDAVTPLSKIDITADELIVKDSTGAAQVLTSVSVVIDITVAGANGLDTGAEASSTWYYGYVIAKADGTTAGLLSVSSSAPTLPSGYTYKALVSAVRNDGSSNFIAYRQFGRRVFYQAYQQTALFSKTDTVEASASMASTVPAIATELLFDLSTACTADGSGIANITPHLRIVTGVDYYARAWKILGQGAGGVVQVPAWMGSIPNVGQNIFYLLTNTNGTGNMTLDAIGFTLPGGGE